MSLIERLKTGDGEVAIFGLGYVGLPLALKNLGSPDLEVVVTDHSSYDWEEIARRAPLILDTRNALRRVDSAAGSVIRL